MTSLAFECDLEGPSAVPSVDVAVCVPTYQRPKFLAELLGSLARSETDDLTVRVLVVDNDGAGSARPVVESFAALLPGLAYEIEPARGLAAVRNRLVALANQVGSQYVAFVDDDEWVVPNWLPDLVATARTYDADVVAGPVVPEYEVTMPAWIMAGGFYDRPRWPTGTPIKMAGTCNLLLRRAWLEQVEGPFDRRFDLTSGEDTHLLERLARQGAHMVWCDEAIAHERIPTSRGTLQWLLQRAFRGGVTYSHCTLALEPGMKARLDRGARALGRLGEGSVMTLLALPHGRVAVLQALRRCAVGVGGIVGAFGGSYEEYRRVHGR